MQAGSNLQANDHRRQLLFFDVVPQCTEQTMWVVAGVLDDLAQLNDFYILHTSFHCSDIISLLTVLLFVKNVEYFRKFVKIH